ncbi:hypothetical protein B0H17DRAFT_1153496 [Mycena rosella]|uniref:Uncharacterized protein n=1 Tax=Mycena rosella TaxID=1033263 RepID=A0AAD7FA17_MYCRO|nr:hypothetical protein B0H17DRAFT_1153496 [Mycena rosella]
MRRRFMTRTGTVALDHLSVAAHATYYYRLCAGSNPCADEDIVHFPHWVQLQMQRESWSCARATFAASRSNTPSTAPHGSAVARRVGFRGKQHYEMRAMGGSVVLWLPPYKRVGRAQFAGCKAGSRTVRQRSQRAAKLAEDALSGVLLYGDKSRPRESTGRAAGTRVIRKRWVALGTNPHDSRGCVEKSANLRGVVRVQHARRMGGVRSAEYAAKLSRLVRRNSGRESGSTLFAPHWASSQKRQTMSTLESERRSPANAGISGRADARDVATRIRARGTHAASLQYCEHAKDANSIAGSASAERLGISSASNQGVLKAEDSHHRSVPKVQRRVKRAHAWLLGRRDWSASRTKAAYNDGDRWVGLDERVELAGSDGGYMESRRRRLAHRAATANDMLRARSPFASRTRAMATARVMDIEVGSRGLPRNECSDLRHGREPTKALVYARGPSRAAPRKHRFDGIKAGSAHPISTGPTLGDLAASASGRSSNSGDLVDQ